MKVAPRAVKYFVPHHPVVKWVATGCEIRVVFDASAPLTAGTSLNACLITEPKLQTEIGDVLLRNQFVFTTDITKMYRQIRVHESDRIYQRIVCRSSPCEEDQEYKLCMVTYGIELSSIFSHTVFTTTWWGKWTWISTRHKYSNPRRIDLSVLTM